jgi:sensor c-di-GMP phosphodiesterase-like protein
LRNADPKTAALQLGTAFVAFGLEPPANPGPISMQVSTTIKEADYRQSSSSAIGSLVGRLLNWTADGTVRQGDTLYATRCSTRRPNCVTASASVSEASQSEYAIVVGCTVTGGLFGILGGMALSFAYSRRGDMCQQLRRAVHRDEVQVVYQPIVVLSTRQIVGAEALARWTDEEGNAVDPEVFVKVAEEHGFVGALTKSVLHQALKDFAETLQSRPGFRLSLNAAGADLVDPEFLPMLEDTLKRAKVNPESIVIEISEKSASKSDAAMETIRILRRRGHSINIDDFGTGYSNLDKLLCLFADTIKIDKAFTGVIGTESAAVAILPQILAMAKSLNLEVVVEGVETDRQADYFSPETAHLYGQGWLYGRPVAAEAFNCLLADNSGVVLATRAAASYAPATQQPAAEELDAGWISKPCALHLVTFRAA